MVALVDRATPEQERLSGRTTSSLDRKVESILSTKALHVVVIGLNAIAGIER